MASTGGEIAVDGERVEGPHRNRGLVFQQHTLFPWKRVIDNVAFGLKMNGLGVEERHREPRALLELVGLRGFEARYPVQLSGGTQQRVEIARALINRPHIHPDGRTVRRTLRADAPDDAESSARCVDAHAHVVMFVTHDIDEALFLADRILVLSRRPARIVADIVVPLARPRDDESTVAPEFIEINWRCLALLRDTA